MPSPVPYLKYADKIAKLDEAVADALATCNKMIAKFEATMAAETIAFEQALTTLHHENQESQRQFMINMQTFQTNMANTVIICIMNYQATFQQALQAQFNLFELSMEQQILANSPILNGLETTPSCLDNPPASTVTYPVDTKSATKPYTCNRTRYPPSTMSTRYISINISPRIWKITFVVFGYASVSNFSYADPPLPQPHCLNLPPSQAKKKGVYSY